MSDPATAAPTVARARRKFKPLPPVERLRELFELREDGVLIWRWRADVPLHVNKRLAGMEAGAPDKYGYTRIGILGSLYYSHRIIVAMLHGVDPGDSDVDHANRDKTCNAPLNLRTATHGANIHNAKIRIDNSSGARGVTWRSDMKKWHVRIGFEGKFIHLGYFSRFDKANDKYIAASMELYGEFSPFQGNA